MSRTKLLILLAVALLVTVPATGLVRADSHWEGEGTAVIWDNFALSDAVTYSMTGVTNAGANMTYEGWLITDNGSVKTSTGIMDASGGSIDYSWSSPDGENLIARYDMLVITVEPVPDADPAPSGVVAFSDKIPAAGMVHIRHLLTSWPDGADNGILTNLKGQLGVAITHAGLAASAGTIDGIRQHLEHVINAIEGPNGANYGDLDGNGAAEDVGDGVGILPHAADRQHGPFAAGAAPGDEEITDGALLVALYGANAEAWVLEARDNALGILNQSSLAVATALLATVTGPLDAALNGVAATGDGGANQAYVEAQMMATYTLSPGGGAGPSTPTIGLPGTGDSAVPLLAQIALVVGLAAFATGGLFVLRGRRYRASA
jgi:hypothetical protein